MSVLTRNNDNTRKNKKNEKKKKIQDYFMSDTGRSVGFRHKVDCVNNVPLSIYGNNLSKTRE